MGRPVADSARRGAADGQTARHALSRWHRVVLAGWLVYWAGLTYLLLAPKVPRPPITISPKGLVVHFGTFAILAYGCVLARRSGGRPCTLRWALAWLVVLAAFGGLTELLQPLSGRHRDIEDFIADAAGAAVVLIASVLRWRRHPM